MERIRAIQYDDKYTLLANIAFDLSRTSDITKTSSLAFIPGVTVTYEYYAAQEAGNPNDSINVKSETYTLEGQQVLKRTYVYNDDNLVSSITIV